MLLDLGFGESSNDTEATPFASPLALGSESEVFCCDCNVLLPKDVQLNETFGPGSSFNTFCLCFYNKVIRARTCK